MEDILKEGIEKGVYRTGYPRQTAELLVLYGKALVEPNILPAAKGDDLRLRAQFFVQIMTGWLNPSPEHARRIIALFDQLL